MRAHLRRLADRGFAATSVARRLSAIRQLYRFLYAEARRADDPAAIVEGPKRGRTLPKLLTIEEVDRLLGAAQAGLEGERPISDNYYDLYTKTCRAARGLDDAPRAGRPPEETQP